MSQSVRDARPYVIWPVTIPSGASICPTGISMAGYKHAAFLVPSGSNYSMLTFQGSIDNVNFYNLQMDGVEVQQIASANVLTVADQFLTAFSTVNFLTVRAGTSALPIVQTGSAGSTIQVLMSV
jgi:hypothetical protein